MKMDKKVLRNLIYIALLFLISTLGFSEAKKAPNEVIKDNPYKEVKTVEADKNREHAEFKLSVNKIIPKGIESYKLSETEYYLNLGDSKKNSLSEIYFLSKTLDDIPDISIVNNKKVFRNLNNFKDYSVETAEFSYVQKDNYILVDKAPYGIEEFYVTKLDRTNGEIKDVYKVGSSKLQELQELKGVITEKSTHVVFDLDEKALKELTNEKNTVEIGKSFKEILQENRLLRSAAPEKLEYKIDKKNRKLLVKDVDTLGELKIVVSGETGIKSIYKGRVYLPEIRNEVEPYIWSVYEPYRTLSKEEMLPDGNYIVRTGRVSNIFFYKKHADKDINIGPFYYKDAEMTSTVVNTNGIGPITSSESIFLNFTGNPVRTEVFGYFSKVFAGSDKKGSINYADYYKGQDTGLLSGIKPTKFYDTDSYGRIGEIITLEVGVYLYYVKELRRYPLARTFRNTTRMTMINVAKVGNHYTTIAQIGEINGTLPGSFPILEYPQEIITFVGDNKGAEKLNKTENNFKWESGDSLNVGIVVGEVWKDLAKEESFVGKGLDLPTLGIKIINSGENIKFIKSGFLDVDEKIAFYVRNKKGRVENALFNIRNSSAKETFNVSNLEMGRSVSSSLKYLLERDKVVIKDGTGKELYTASSADFKATGYLLGEYGVKLTSVGEALTAEKAGYMSANDAPLTVELYQGDVKRDVINIKLTNQEAVEDFNISNLVLNTGEILSQRPYFLNRNKVIIKKGEEKLYEDTVEQIELKGVPISEYGAFLMAEKSPSSQLKINRMGYMSATGAPLVVELYQDDIKRDVINIKVTNQEKIETFNVSDENIGGKVSSDSKLLLSKSKIIIKKGEEKLYEDTVSKFKSVGYLLPEYGIKLISLENKLTAEKAGYMSVTGAPLTVELYQGNEKRDVINIKLTNQRATDTLDVSLIETGGVVNTSIGYLSERDSIKIYKATNSLYESPIADFNFPYSEAGISLGKNSENKIIGTRDSIKEYNDKVIVKLYKDDIQRDEIEMTLINSGKITVDIGTREIRVDSRIKNGYTNANFVLSNMNSSTDRPHDGVISEWVSGGMGQRKDMVQAIGSYVLATTKELEVESVDGKVLVESQNEASIESWQDWRTSSGSKDSFVILNKMRSKGATIAQRNATQRIRFSIMEIKDTNDRFVLVDSTKNERYIGRFKKTFVYEEINAVANLDISKLSANEEINWKSGEEKSSKPGTELEFVGEAKNKKIFDTLGVATGASIVTDLSVKSSSEGTKTSIAEDVGQERAVEFTNLKIGIKANGSLYILKKKDVKFEDTYDIDIKYVDKGDKSKTPAALGTLKLRVSNTPIENDIENEGFDFFDISQGNRIEGRNIYPWNTRTEIEFIDREGRAKGYRGTIDEFTANGFEIKELGVKLSRDIESGKIIAERKSGIPGHIIFKLNLYQDSVVKNAIEISVSNYSNIEVMPGSDRLDFGHFPQDSTKIAENLIKIKNPDRYRIEIKAPTSGKMYKQGAKITETTTIDIEDIAVSELNHSNAGEPSFKMRGRAIAKPNQELGKYQGMVEVEIIFLVK